MPMATASTERTRLTRRNVLRCALVAPAVVAGARRASAAEPVSVGMVNTISDAGFFVAEAKGYFQGCRNRRQIFALSLGLGHDRPARFR